MSFQVPAALDAALDIAGGSINIHVLMAVAGLASVAMGNGLEGALLLAMFAAAHIGEWCSLNEVNREGSRTQVKVTRENEVAA